MANQKKKTTEPWRKKIDALELSICDVYCDIFGQMSDEDLADADEFEEAVGKLDPISSVMRVIACIRQVEKVFRKIVAKVLSENDTTSKLKELKRLVPSGWLERTLHQHVQTSSECMKHFKYAAKELSEFQQKYNGDGAFLLGIWRGMNIAAEEDGIASIFGEGSANNDLKRVRKSYRNAIDRLAKSAGELVSAIEDSIVDKWNQEVMALAKD